MFVFQNKQLTFRIALLICAIVFGVWPYVDKVLHVPTFGLSDFAVFYSAAQVIDGTVAVEAPEIYIRKFFFPLVEALRPTSGGTKFLYPPQAAVLFAPFALFPFATANALWIFFNVAMLICTYYAIIRFLLHDDITKLRYSIFLAIFLRFSVAHELLRTGQINGVVLALLVLTIIALEKKKMRSGVPLALATSIKIFPGVYALLLVAKKQWRAFAVYCAAMFALWLATVPFFGWLGLLHFYEHPLKKILAGTINNPAASASLYGLLIRVVNTMHLQHAHTIVVVGGNALTVLLAVSLLCIAFLFMRGRMNTLFAYCFFTCAVLLFSKFTQTQYALYLLPLALLMLQRVHISRWVLSTLCIAALYCALFWSTVPALHTFFYKRLNLIGIVLATIYLLLLTRNTKRDKLGAARKK
ncbi:MAG: DUF2029 domain-containing protein [Candidatus Kerfeldbacteria bacterium]|nr:DUF2029 domain-containing protein [Candidatus Kerfeldbacteria bacterium]